MLPGDEQHSKRKTKRIFFPLKKEVDLTPHKARVHKNHCDLRDCDCPAIESGSSYRYLGLTLQSNLKFNLHVSNITSRMRQGSRFCHA